MSVFILENIFKSYKVNKIDYPVLSGINLTLPERGFVSIVGKSGSGKSTLLNLLMGIEKPTKGKIFYKGKNITKFKDKTFSDFHLNGVSLVFQHYNLFENLSVIDNVTLPLLMRNENKIDAKEKATKLLMQLNIADLAKRKVKNLSGGEKQRVAILRALITNPDVILCDEPTGALDYKNSREIMDILKNLSKKCLIVMVSHNRELVNKFSDQIIELNDGKIVKNITSIKDTFTSNYRRTKTRYSDKWMNKFFISNIRKNFLKNVFSLISCIVGFTSIFLCAGFAFGSEKSQEQALRNNLSIGYSTVSKIEEVDIKDSPLLYKKTTRPNLEDIEDKLSDLSSIRFEENYSYLFSCYPTLNYKGNSYLDFQMVPLYDSTLKNYGKELLIDGKEADGTIFECYVNEECAKMLNLNKCGDIVTITNSSTVSYKTFDEDEPFIKDTLNIDINLKIVGIFNEFPFLNSPKLYYSYKGGKSFLKQQKMENLSKYLGYQFTYYDYIISCDNDDPACSYSSYLFLDNLNEVDDFFNKISDLQDSDIEITSTVFNIKDTYSSFISSFSKTLIVFVGIAFIGINFVLGIIALSTFLENRKQTAIMTCVGSRNKTIYSLYLREILLIVFASFFLSFFLSMYLQGFANQKILESFSLPNLLDIPFKQTIFIPFGFPIIVLIIAIVFASIFVLTPMMIYRNKSISNELRDE